MTGTELLRMDWLGEGDVYAVRQRGREVAAALGVEPQDQVRIATALSEVGREVMGAGAGSVQFVVSAAGDRLDVVLAAGRGPGRAVLEGSTGVAAARRLVDRVTVESGGDGADGAARDGGCRVTLTRALPRGTRADQAVITRARARVTALAPATLLDELRAQNSELVGTLDQLEARQQDLLRVNQELEDTNQGVLAMYTQLSSELEETNRGVVALYAELDEKGQQLAEANEAKTRFLRTISHELRSPVTSILGLTDLLAESRLDGEQRHQVDLLHGSAGSLLHLVNELLDLARAESGRQDVHLEEVALGPLFADLRGTMRPLAQTRGLALDIPQPAVPGLRTDAELLARVLRNLLSNALKFTERGHVRMTATRLESGQHVRIDVEDTGIGIAPGDAEGVFEEFYQVPGPLQGAAAGTGLGLPYARRVCESLGGTLILASTPGKGSTFTVTLPAPVDDGLPEQDGGPIGHVLLVDDDEAFRHVVRGLLQGVAERVSEAPDGEAALVLAQRAVPDVILLDLRMPVLDGAGTLTRLRADPALRDIPVVLLTSVDIDADVRLTLDPVPVLLNKAQLTRRRLVSLLHQVLAGEAR